MSDIKEQLLGTVLAYVDELEDEDRDPGEWLDEQLSIEVFMFDYSMQFVGAEVLCGFGGPDIRVDTRWDEVIGNWGGDSISRKYDDNICLNDYLEEIANSMI